MAGAFTIIAKIDDREILRALDRLHSKSANLQPCLKNIGEHLVKSTQERFTAEEDPAGKKWAALKASTENRKKNPKILTESHQLRDSVVYAVRNNGLRVGTNKVYGAAHQFGIDKDLHVPAHKRAVTKAWGKELKFPVWAQVKAHSFNPKLPARPFLGFSVSDRVEIRDIIEDFITKP
jgi:phage virion morphogenesis protein